MLCGELVVFQIERDFRGTPRRQVYANFSDIVLETPSWDSVPSSNVVGTLCNFVLHSHQLRRQDITKQHFWNCEEKAGCSNDSYSTLAPFIFPRLNFSWLSPVSVPRGIQIGSCCSLRFIPSLLSSFKFSLYQLLITFTGDRFENVRNSR